MPQLTVGTQLDDASIRRAAAQLQQRFDRLGQNVTDDFWEPFVRGARTGAQAVDKAMDRAQDSIGAVRREQAKLDELLSSGNATQSRVIAQSERVAKARRDEARAVQQAARAYQDYSEESGENALGAFVDGLKSGAGLAGAGRQAAETFTGGFSGSGAIASLGSRGGPIGLAFASAVLLAGVAGKQMAQAVAEGMQTLKMQDLFQARMGLDDASMANVAGAAGRAYASNFGESVEANLTAAQSALRAGLIDPEATAVEIQSVVEQLQGLSTVTESTAAELSRSITTLMRTGMAGSVSEASDIITAGFQKGLDVSNDYLDTVNEYSTQFRKLGLDADEWLTLLKQGLEGGARDTDKVADALKEFSIRAVDGSKSTKEGFEALGFSMEDMSRRFAAGGDTARSALAAVLDALRSLDDPMQQALVWQRLFGTQFEDLGDAVNRFDLSPAKSEFRDLAGTADEATTTATDNFASNWDEAMRTVEQRFSDFKTKLAEWVTDLPFIRDLPLMIQQAFDPDSFGWDAPPWAVSGTPLRPNDLPALAPPGREPGQVMGPFIPGVEPPAPLPVVPNDLDARQRLLLPGESDPVPIQPGDNFYQYWYPRPDDPNAPTPGERTPISVDPDADSGGGGGGSEKPNLPTSQWSLDAVPLGSFPGEEGLAPIAATGPIIPIGPVDPQKVFDAETSAMNAANSLQQARIRYLELQQSENATEQELHNARAALVSQGRALQSAQMKLIEAQQGAAEKLSATAGKMTGAMEQLGAALDPDFGLGNGLPGLVENLTKALANLAMAPALGALGAVKQAGGHLGGHGVFGMFGANNVSNGLSPLGFGPLGTGGGYAGGAYMPGIQSAGYYANPNVGAMMSLAQWSSGKTKYAPASDLINGLADCSGSISDLVEVLQTGRTSPDRLFTTTNFASDAEAAKLGFKPGFKPGALNVGVNPYPGQSGHMAATLPNGVNFEGGGGTGGGAQYGGNAAGALDPQFEKQYHMPIGGYAAVAPSVGVPTTSYTPTLSEVYSPANTNPALNNPAAPTGGGSLPGIGPVPQAGGLVPQYGVPAPQALLASANPGVQPGGAPGATGGGFAGVGGLPMAGISTAISAAGLPIDAMAPGAGQVAAAAAETGIQLANRTAGFAGQVLGTLAGGLLETFSVSNGNPLTDPLKTLPGRVIAGIAGARPALPNTAGLLSQQGQQQQAQQHQQGGQPQPGQTGGPLVNIENVHQAAGEQPDAVAQSVASQFRSAELTRGFTR